MKDRFLPAFVKMAKALRIGDPRSNGTDIGPMVSEQERETSIKFVELAKDEGGKVILGSLEERSRRIMVKDGSMSRQS